MSTTSPRETVLNAVAEFGSGLRVACSASMEDALVVHWVAQAAAEIDDPAKTPRVLVLDTGRLHEETYATLERMRRRYALPFDFWTPHAELLQPMLLLKGPASFRESVGARKECCQIRKVEPLGRALASASAWLTGMRKAHFDGRSALEICQLDERGLTKINPLADLSDTALHEIAAREGIEVHPLHQQGFPSIGCAPCTRAVQPGEDFRAGRWWWEEPEHKECGIHEHRTRHPSPR